MLSQDDLDVGGQTPGRRARPQLEQLLSGKKQLAQSLAVKATQARRGLAAQRMLAIRLVFAIVLAVAATAAVAAVKCSSCCFAFLRALASVLAGPARTFVVLDT